MKEVTIDAICSPDDGGWHCEVWDTDTGKTFEEFDGSVFDTRDEAITEAVEWLRENGTEEQAFPVVELESRTTEKQLAPVLKAEYSHNGVTRQMVLDAFEKVNHIPAGVEVFPHLIILQFNGITVQFYGPTVRTITDGIESTLSWGDWLETQERNFLNVVSILPGGRKWLRRFRKSSRR